MAIFGRRPATGGTGVRRAVTRQEECEIGGFVRTSHDRGVAYPLVVRALEGLVPCARGGVAKDAEILVPRRFRLASFGHQAERAERRPVGPQ